MKNNWLSISLFLIVVSACCGQSQDKSTMLRIANLLPIGSEKVDLYQGGELLLQGLKPGFIRGYDAGDLTAGNSIELRRGNAVLARGKLESSNTKGFFTVLIIQDATGAPELRIVDDALPPAQDADGNSVPKNRLRVYCGDYGFPIQISIGETLKWLSNGEALFVDFALTSKPPESVMVSFIDRFDEKIDLYFPTDFTSNQAYSVFVTHRGTKRPRVAAYPDSVLPMEDPEAPKVETSAELSNSSVPSN